jgi:hypothetical protein
MGAHQSPRGRSRGKYSTDPVKLRGPVSTIQALREKMAQQSPNGKDYGNVEVEITAEYFEGVEKPLLVSCERCVWVTSRAAAEEGAEILKEEIEFNTMRIRRNGTCLFDSDQGVP